MNKNRFFIFGVTLVSSFLFFGVAPASASGGESGTHSVHHFGIVFAMFALVLLAGKLGSIVERFGQPAVIGELIFGIALSALGYFGWSFITDTSSNTVIMFIANFGALLLLFSIGLESNLGEMKKVGVNALLVAFVGVIVPFVLGAYVLAPLFFADASQNAKLFIGAALVATSVGITASVFRALNISKTKVAQTVLGAAVIDDILGLIVLGVVSALASGASVSALSISWIFVKSFGFMVIAVVVGALFAEQFSRVLSKINTGIGMKVALAVTFALVFGYAAELFGLEPIIGAFAAGLLFDHVHFRRFDDSDIIAELVCMECISTRDKKKVDSIIGKHRNAHVEDLVNTLGLTFIPVFFVFTGMQIDFGSLLQPKLYFVAGVISIFAILGKLVSGFVVKGSLNEKLLVGMSMVPRGEVGLIFAATGKGLGVLSDELFSVIVMVVIVTTFIAPPLIKKLAKRVESDSSTDDVVDLAESEVDDPSLEDYQVPGVTNS